MMKRIALILGFPVLVLGCTIALLRFVTTTFTNPDKAVQIAFMVDETTNVGLNGKVDTSISARAARARNAGRRWGCVLCRFLDWLSANHCDNVLKEGNQ